MEDDFVLAPFGTEIRRAMKTMGNSYANYRHNYWRNKQMEIEQERRIRAQESQYDNEWKEYTSTGEEWEIGEDW